MALDIELDRKYVNDTPVEIQARRQRILAILRKYRHHLLTPAPPSPKMELVSIEEGESHD
jgi:hypothetical protein